MTTSVPQRQTYVETGRPSIASIAGILLIITGFLGLAESWLILVSPILFGWFLIGGIGLITLASGIGLFQDADWAWSTAVMMGIVSIFAGFIEILGAFNPYLIIVGLGGLGGYIGIGTLILSGVALYILYRPEVASYYSY